MEGPSERRLVVMRHARAESFALEDRLRELTGQGRVDAADAGRWVAEAGLHVDAAVVSAAVRTRQTWAAFAEAAGCEDVEPTFEEALYSAGTDTVLECLRNLPEGATTALFIGHNPTAGMLVQVLADGSGDAEVHGRLANGFPPASVAVLAFTGPWAGVDLGTGRLVDARVVHG